MNEARGETVGYVTEPCPLLVLFQGFVNYLDEDINGTKVKFVEHSQLEETANMVESKSHDIFTH